MYIRKHKILSFFARARYAEQELGYCICFQAHLSSRGQLLVAFFSTAAFEHCARCVQHS